MNPSKLLQVIVSRIPSRTKRDGRTEWNKATKEVLCELGRKQGFRRYASVHLLKERLNEWMLDVVWYSAGRNGGIQLAVESELGTKEQVLEDFEKLMCVKAPLKLLIFESGDSDIVLQLQNYLAEFEQHIKGETYLFADFNWGRHECYKFVVLRNGRQKERRCHVAQNASLFWTRHAEGKFRGCALKFASKRPANLTKTVNFEPNGDGSCCLCIEA